LCCMHMSTNMLVAVTSVHAYNFNIRK